jgi:hypothetical protein
VLGLQQLLLGKAELYSSSSQSSAIIISSTGCSSSSSHTPARHLAMKKKSNAKLLKIKVI